jgi:hypothetical protein
VSTVAAAPGRENSFDPHLEECQKLTYFSDTMTETLSEQILSTFSALAEGEPLSAKALLHLGSRAAVDQALARLTRRGQIIRLARGQYVRPVQTRFGQRSPEVEKTVQALAASLGEVIAASGAAAANRLGLSVQVPVRPVYLTSGRSRTLYFGKQTVELKHAPSWLLLEAQSPVGDLLRAAQWAGAELSGEVLHKGMSRLSPIERTTLARLRGRMPAWLAQSVSKVVTAYG